jgi:hypothetical protein
MSKKATLQALKNDLKNEEPADIAKELGLGTEKLTSIPLGVRTNHTVYFETRQYIALQDISNRTGNSVQNLLREGVKLILNKYNRKR